VLFVICYEAPVRKGIFCVSGNVLYVIPASPVMYFARNKLKRIMLPRLAPVPFATLKRSKRFREAIETVSLCRLYWSTTEGFSFILSNPLDYFLASPLSSFGQLLINRFISPTLLPLQEYPGKASDKAHRNSTRRWTLRHLIAGNLAGRRFTGSSDCQMLAQHTEGELQRFPQNHLLRWLVEGDIFSL